MSAMTIIPEPLAPDFQKFVDAIAAAHAAGAPKWHELTPGEIRTATQNLRKCVAPVNGVTRRNLQIKGASGPLDARLYVPDGAGKIGPGLVYFHGGGFTIGSIETHDSIVAKLAVASGVKIMSVEYRLAPEHIFPAAHDDAIASAKWAFDHADTIGFDRDRIALGGDSAGANLAASVCFDLRDEGKRNVNFQLLLYPNTTINDIAGSRDVYAQGHYLTLQAAHHLFRQYVTDEQAQNIRIDLLHRCDLTGLPPTFLTIGHCDILLDECLAYANKMKAAGVVVEVRTYPGFIHGFYGFEEQVPLVATAFNEAGAALANGLGLTT